MKSAAVKWAAGIFMESTAKSSPLSGGAEVALEGVAQISQSFEGRRDPIERALQNFGSGEDHEKAESFATLHRYEANDTDACAPITRAGAAVSHPLHLPFNLALLCFPCLFCNPPNNQMYRLHPTGEIAGERGRAWRVGGLWLRCSCPRCFNRRDGGDVESPGLETGKAFSC